MESWPAHVFITVNYLKRNCKYVAITPINPETGLNMLSELKQRIEDKTKNTSGAGNDGDYRSNA